MTICIAVFRTKTEVFAFMELMRRNGAWSETIGTPKESGVGCGLSVKFMAQNLPTARDILLKHNFASFHGVYKQTRQGSRTTLSKIM